MKKRFRMLLLHCVLGLDVWVDMKMLHEDLVMKMWMTKSLCVCYWEDGGTQCLSCQGSCILWDVRIALIRWHQTGICEFCGSVGERDALWTSVVEFISWVTERRMVNMAKAKAKREEKNPWAEEFMGKHQKMSNIRKHSRANFKYQITWMRIVM